MRFSLLFIVLLLSACTSPNRRVIGPDGTEYIKIECVEIEQCYENADKVCEHRRQFNMSSDSGTTLKTLLIQCEK